MSCARRSSSTDAERQIGTGRGLEPLLAGRNFVVEVSDDETGRRTFNSATSVDMPLGS